MNGIEKQNKKLLNKKIMFQNQTKKTIDRKKWSYLAIDFYFGSGGGFLPRENKIIDVFFSRFSFKKPTNKRKQKETQKKIDQDISFIR